MSTVTVKTNVAELGRTLADLPNALDLDAGRLGDRLANALAPRIKERFDAQRGPNGRFSKNRGRYGKTKRARGIPVGVGLRNGGEMSRLANFLGRRTVAKDEASMEFGVTDSARRKGMWFTTGSGESADGYESSGASNQPPRPFYELNESDIAAIADVCVERIMEHIQRM